MRPSNKRSRSKQNRSRSLGNVVNRVFDSSGPEGKVRGTPQQIIDKYLVLARDAQLAGDRVAAENFLQHAEHYTRLLNEAQAEQAREAEARREQQQKQQERRENNRDDAESDGGEQPQRERRNNRRNRRDAERDGEREAQPNQGQTGENAESDTMLVETPESRAQSESAPQTGEGDDAARPQRNRRTPRKPRAPKAEAAKDDTAQAEAPATAPTDGGEQPAPAVEQAPAQSPDAAE